MDFNVIWSEPSLKDLEEILAHIAMESRAVAQRLGTKIVEAVEMLQQFPMMGSIYRTDRGSEIRQLITASYRIFLHSK